MRFTRASFWRIALLRCRHFDAIPQVENRQYCNPETRRMKEENKEIRVVRFRPSFPSSWGYNVGVCAPARLHHSVNLNRHDIFTVTHQSSQLLPVFDWRRRSLTRECESIWFRLMVDLSCKVLFPSGEPHTRHKHHSGQTEHSRFLSCFAGRVDGQIDEKI